MADDLALAMRDKYGRFDIGGDFERRMVPAECLAWPAVEGRSDRLKFVTGVPR